jgi:hypothetical protein
MDVPLAVLADYANVSREGKLNIMGIFAEIRPAAFPALVPSMHLVLVLRYGPAERGETKEIVIRALDADGNIMVELRTTVPIAADAPLVGTVQSIVSINGMAFQHAGDYAFDVLVGGEPKAHVGFTVFAPPAEDNAAPS